MLDDLTALERVADESIERRSLLQLPARAVLAGLHYISFLGRHGRQFGGAVAAAQGEAIVTRLGHALPLLRKLRSEPFGASAEDAIGAFQGEAAVDGALAALLTYLHFSEIVPEARRGRLVVFRDGDRLTLRHPDDAFARAEALDITLSELAIPFSLDTDTSIEPEFGRLATTVPEIEWAFVARFISTNAYKYRRALAEADLITDTSINHMFGFSRDRSLFIRSALMAFAEFCEKLAVTMHLGVFARKLHEDRLAEALEWVSVCLKADFVHGFIAAASGSTEEEVERFLEIYSIDYRQNPPVQWGGDGFFPPFARFDQGYVFSPGLVLAFLQVRNAIYAFAKKDKTTFDNDVSHELEPVLLHQAGELLRRGGDWIVIEDIPFPGGQIDLLISAPGDDAVLLVQAKGNLPPQGSRLTERLTDRVREGVRQIERFAALDKRRQREVIEAALGRPVEEVIVHHAILARSCFGAPDVLADDFPYVRMTLPILALALDRHRSEDLPTTVAGLIDAIQRTFASVIEESDPRWEDGSIEVEGTTINLPLLKWRDGELDRIRRSWWEATVRPDRPLD
jgi:hypothetical protein